jgi:hypothetical protein
MNQLQSLKFGIVPIRDFLLSLDIRLLLLLDWRGRLEYRQDIIPFEEVD